jgi:hypothetical protein
MLPVPVQQGVPTHFPWSASDTIASDDETPICSIAFQSAKTPNGAGPSVRRSTRDTKGKSKAKDE